MWKTIEDFENYEVSDDGRIRNNRTGRELKLKQNNVGRCQIALWKNKKPHYFLVSRLVCESFHGPQPEDKPFALHWDGNHLNNSEGNLRWGSRKENAADSLRLGENSVFKLNEEQRQQMIKEYQSGSTNGELSKRYGVCCSRVSIITRGRK